MVCNLNCYLPTAATPVLLPGSTGIGTDIGVPDLTLSQCRDACRSFQGCEAIVHDRSGSGKCYGKRDVRTSASEGGCMVQPPYHTEMVCGMPWGKCMLLGDPHITTFDRKMLGSYPQEQEDQAGENFYMVPLEWFQAGEYHLVLGESLDIQGRFGFTTAYGAASSTLGVAAGGSLLGNHRLAVAYVGPQAQTPAYRGWKVTWDGVVILHNFPGSFVSSDGMLNATFADMEPMDYATQARSTIGTAPGLHPSYVFNLGEKQHVQIYVLPGPDLCNVVITMQKLDPRQHGFCGDFNCNRADDTLDILRERGLLTPISRDRSLFPTALASPAGWDIPTGPVLSVEDVISKCPPQILQQAGCTGTGAARDSCLFDACVGAVTAAQVKLQRKFDGLVPVEVVQGWSLRWKGGTAQTCAAGAALLGCLAVLYMWRPASRLAQRPQAYALLPTGDAVDAMDAESPDSDDDSRRCDRMPLLPASCLRLPATPASSGSAPGRGYSVLPMNQGDFGL